MTKDEIKKRTANLIIKHKEQSADWLYANGYTSAADYEASMLIARIAELEAALRPFTDVESIVPFFHDAGWGLYAHVVTKRDMEAARAALEKKDA